jgi:ATP-binding cassette subfamily B protein
MKPMFVLVRLIRYSPRYFVLCVAFACVEIGLVPIPMGLAARGFFDALSPQSTGLGIWSAIVLLVAVQLVEACTGPVLGNPWNSLQQKSRVLLQRNLMAGIMRGYGRYGLRESVGETISRFRDDPDSIADGLDAVCDLIGRTLFAVGAVVVMWGINPVLTLVVCLPLLLSAWLTEALGTRTMAYRAAARAATSSLTGFLGELLAAHLALTVAGASHAAVARLNTMGEARRRMSVRDSTFGVLLDSFSINIGHIGAGLVLLVGAQLVGAGGFSVGDFALFVVYLDQLVWYPAEIARLISDLKRIEIAYGRMCALVPGDQPAALVARVTRVTAPHPVEIAMPNGDWRDGPAADRLRRLEVHGLSHAYCNGGGGVRDVSFTLERGSFTVITGRIGAGKSTLLQVLLGLLPHEAGDILWNGRPVEDASRFFVPPRSAYTPQVPRLFSETLRDNVVLGRGVAPVALERAVRAAVLERDVAALALGLDTLVGPRGVKLSGGQVQRAAAARMFIAEADLLVLDDLSSALDAETEAELWARLFARGREVTCLVVSHRPAALRRADQVLVLEAGRLAELAAPAEQVNLPLLPAAGARQPDGRVDVGPRLER